VIPVTDGENTVRALVSDSDYPTLRTHIWCLWKGGAGPWNGEKFMDEYIVYRKGRRHSVIEHLNGNMLDYRRENLRLIVFGMNAELKQKCSSKYTGVYWVKEKRKWRALIGMDGKSKHLGYYYREEDAAEAHRRAFELKMDIYARRRQVYSFLIHCFVYFGCIMFVKLSPGITLFRFQQ